MTLPRLLLIFSLFQSPLAALVFTFVRPLCIQYLTNGLSWQHSLWASSFSWWGNFRSSPPPWMSKVSPRYLALIALHSICHPGRPSPQGLGQAGSPGLAAFQRAKSLAVFFPLPDRSRRPASWSASLRLLSLP